MSISFASGWQPNDFVLMPQNFANAKQAMFDGIDAVKRLWRGEKVSFPGATGTPEQPVMVEVATLPRPVQAELPVWVTTAGNPETYIQAGRIGANVLTHLLGQSVEQLGPKIAAYRQARADAGFDPDAGVVSLMLHTFVGDDEDAVRDDRARAAQAVPRNVVLAAQGVRLGVPGVPAPGRTPTLGVRPRRRGLQEPLRRGPRRRARVRLPALLRVEWPVRHAGALPAMVDQLKGIGVNEIACLVDFGVATDTVLASLPTLDVIRREANRRVAEPPAPVVEAALEVSADQSLAAQLDRHGVTHLQCTPSMARMFSMDDDARAALAEVEHLFIGGEAFPVALAKDLKALSRSGNITNMYGPTETTIWSTTGRSTATSTSSRSARRSPTRRSTSSTSTASRSRPASPASCGSAATASCAATTTAPS